MLTAFVLRSYALANEWIDIDEMEISKPMSWLLDQQDNTTGCFKNIGETYDKRMATIPTLTAYVFQALLEAGLSDFNLKSAAYQCVRKSFSKLDTFSLNLLATNLVQLGLRGYSYVSNKLSKEAIYKKGPGGNMKAKFYFQTTRSEKQGQRNDSRYYQASASDIESTAIFLTNTLKKKDKSMYIYIAPILNWLTTQRNSRGGWSSPTVTVAVLEALSHVGTLMYNEYLNASVELSYSGSVLKTFDIKHENHAVIQSVKNVPVPSTLQVKIDNPGQGCTVINAVVDYYIKEGKTKGNKSFEIEYNITTIPGKLSLLRVCLTQVLTICVARFDEVESNIAILEVEMVSGFEPNTKRFAKENAAMGVKDMEVHKGVKIVFYFTKLSSEKKCIKLEVRSKHPVKKTKPVSIRLFDYYDKDKSATKFYHFDRQTCRGKRVV